MSENLPRAPGGFAAGSRIAGYLLEEQIGQGGMAVVFRAHDERLDRTVALKILAPALADDEAFQQRFIRESRAAAAVDDPHIIPVFDAGEASGVLFIAMRYVRGGDVGSLVRRSGPLPPARMAGIVSQVASALDAAHARGLVHRDVKPTNMLLDASGGAGRPDHVYLSDFGLSKTSLQVSGLTATGQFLGTLEYIAPEQIESKAVDGRADQYALACATYELLAGVPPFERSTAMALILAQLTDPPPSLASRRPDLPGRVDAVFARSLAKSAADRFATCTDFAEALRAACGLRPYDTSPSAGYQATQLAQAHEQAGPGMPPAPVPLRDQSPPTAAVHDAAPFAPTPPAPAAPPARSPAAAPASRRTAQPPAGPPVTERLTSAGPPDGPRRSSRAVLTAAAVVVLIAAAAVLVKVVAGGSSSPGHPIAGHTTGSAAGTPGCVPPAGVNPVDPAAYQRGPTLTDTGGGQSVVEGAAFSPDGSALAVGDHNGTTSMWRTANFGSPVPFVDPDGSGVQAVAFSCNGKSIAIADAGGSILLWTIGAPAPTSLADPSGPVAVMAVAFRPDDKMLATGDRAGDAYLWRIKTHHYRKLANPGSQGNAVQGVAFSPNGKEVATGDSDGTVYMWSTATGHRLPGYSGASNVQAVAFSPDGTMLAVGDVSGTTYLWNVRNHTYATLRDNGPGSLGVVAVAFSPDGGTLAAGDSNGNTYLWDTSGDNLVRTLSGNGSGVQAVAFSPDGTILAVGYTDGRTYIWKS